MVAFARSSAARAVGVGSKARWRVLYEEVRRRRALGQGLRFIGWSMGLARGTVRRFAHAQGF